MKLFSRTLVILGVFALAITLASSVLATDTRRSATNGSNMINTNTDLNAFPHLALERGGFVELTTGYSGFDDSESGASDGSGRLVAPLNDDNALVFRANDGAYGMRLMNYAWGYTLQMSDPYADGDFPNGFAEGQMFDIDWAHANEGGGGFSVGLGIAMLRQLNGEENTAFAARASLGFSGGNHLSAEFLFNSPSDDPTEYDSGFGATVMYRGTFNSGWTLNAAGYLNKTAAAASDSADTRFGILASLGRHLRNTSSGQVGGEILVDFESKVPDSFSTDATATHFVVPGFRIGATQMLGSTFELLGGATAWWTSISREAASGTDTNERGFAYEYSVGLAAHFGRVTVDTQIHTEALHNITKIANDNDDNLFGSLSINVAL
jgi:hypothetical protein